MRPTPPCVTVLRPASLDASQFGQTPSASSRKWEHLAKYFAVNSSGPYSRTAPGSCCDTWLHGPYGATQGVSIWPQRRADVVASELVNQGVAKEEIVVTAFGETKPLVPTADGVREPQNRRVEIVLR